jgi:hypothetical protein
MSFESKMLRWFGAKYRGLSATALRASGRDDSVSVYAPSVEMTAFWCAPPVEMTAFWCAPPVEMTAFRCAPSVEMTVWCWRVRRDDGEFWWKMVA